MKSKKNKAYALIGFSVILFILAVLLDVPAAIIGWLSGCFWLMAGRILEQEEE